MILPTFCCGTTNRNTEYPGQPGHLPDLAVTAEFSVLEAISSFLLLSCLFFAVESENERGEEGVGGGLKGGKEKRQTTGRIVINT